jgi:HEPN domain-containing protein
MANDSRLSSAAAWFSYAVEDIKAAKILMEAGQYPIACFHAQQAAEKAFKGLLSATNDIEKGHSVSRLAKTVHELQYDANEPLPSVGKLDRFYIATRYPDALPGSSAKDVFDIDDASDAIRVAEQTVLLLAKWGSDAGIAIPEETMAVLRE